MTMHLRRLTCVVAAGATACLGITATAAQADSKHGHHNLTNVLSSSVMAPFNLAVEHNTVYVADGFTNTVGALGKAPIATGPDGGDVAGIDVTTDGRTVAWTWSNADHTATGLTVRTRGKADVVADIAHVEATRNPDEVNTYGVTSYGPGADDDKKVCVDGILAQMAGPEGQAPPSTYKGGIDSHPYSVVRSGHRWVVADAGSNVLWSVTDRGTVSTLAVLPPQPVTFTAEMASSLAAESGAPADAMACLEGVTYAFEPVPTDVEVGRDGSLWVSVLPGGPESPSLGARGAVYKVNAKTGQAKRVAGGFLGATNLAVAPEGTVYVTELFGGKISKIDRHGMVRTAMNFERPLSVEVHGGYLYVGQMADVDFQTGQVKAPGSIVRLKR